MKIKITKSVSAGRKIHVKDSTPDLEAKLGKQLIADGFAEEYVEPKEETPKPGNQPPQ